MYLVEFPRGATPGDDAQGGGRGKITKIKGEARHLETGAIALFIRLHVRDHMPKGRQSKSCR